jgi:hypothetical protein
VSVTLSHEALAATEGQLAALAAARIFDNARLTIQVTPTINCEMASKAQIEVGVVATQILSAVAARKPEKPFVTLCIYEIPVGQDFVLSLNLSRRILASFCKEARRPSACRAPNTSTRWSTRSSKRPKSSRPGIHPYARLTRD